MDFLKDMNKVLEKEGIEGGAAPPPRYWFSSGNYVLNRIISGSFHKGIPQGRVTGLCGPSGAGKSFMVGNLMRAAQQEGAFIVAIDSENALDDEFVSAIGVDPEADYSYVPVDTIAQCNSVTSAVIQGYKKEYGKDNHEAPKLVIFIDSLDMLMTETEMKHFEQGATKGDQGQRNKQLKAMLRGFVQNIKHSNISIVVTGQVYRNQDVMNGEGVWIVSDAIRYALSQIVLITKLKLKADAQVIGIKMRCEGFKTRFTKPFQKVEVLVPYDEGMNPYSGLVDAAKALGIVDQKGSWYTIVGTDTKFQEKNIASVAEDILVKAETMSKSFLEVAEGVEEKADTSKSATSKRKEKFDDDA